MKNVIQITDKILGVIVPSGAYDFEFIHNKTRVGYKIDHRLSYIDLPKGNFIIHGTCTLPLFELDFIYGTGSYDTMVLKKRIKKSINDLGLYSVNPYGENKPQELVDYTGRKDGIIANSLELEQWKSSESKTVKKLLLIEKI
jgi:hypothetical protein